MVARSHWLARQLRWIHPGRNPLVRRCDRVEAALLIVMIILAVVAVPVAVLLGSSQREQALATVAQERATRAPATAVLLAAAPDLVPGEAVASGSESVQASWHLPDGSVRTGVVSVDPGTPAGASVPIWVDRAGNPTAAPGTPAKALSLGIGIGLLSWTAAALALCVLMWMARVVLNHLRAAAWTREWARIGRGLNRF
jgi:hypothetical protein